MSDLKFWNESKHNPAVTKFWKSNSVNELRTNLFNEMKMQFRISRPGVFPFTDDNEESISRQAKLTGITNYEISDVSYTINGAGFRGDWDFSNSADRNIAFFGCSFTFGIGLPVQDLFSTLIGKELGASVLNFGAPGGSFSKAARIYSQVSKYQKLDQVVFVVPHTGRFEVPITHNNAVSMSNMIPNWPFANKDDERMRLKLYEALDDNFLEMETLRNIDHCVSIAKANGTKIYFSSWDMPTYDTLYEHLGKDSGMMLPWFQVVELKTQTGLARDGRHPGPESNRIFATKSLRYLK